MSLLAMGNLKGNLLDIYVTQMQSLIEQADEAQVSISQALSSRYEELVSVFNDTSSLQKRVEVCIKNITELNHKVENDILSSVESSIGEVGQVAARWRKLTGELEASEFLLDVHKCLEDFDERHRQKEYTAAANRLLEAQELLKKAADHEVKMYLNVTSAARDEVCLKRLRLVDDLRDIWENSIKWSEEGSGRNKSTLLVLKCVGEDDENLNNVQDMMGALLVLGELLKPMKMLAKTLLAKVFEPLIQPHTYMEISSSYNRSYTLMIAKCDEAEDESVPLTLQRIREVLEFLHSKLFHAKFEGQEFTLIQSLSEELKEELFELVIKECLAKMVPSSKQELVEYEQIIAIEVQEFHAALIAIGFCLPEDKSLIEYAANVDTVFSNKACADLLSKARQLMKRPLHVTATIDTGEGGETMELVQADGKKLDKNTENLTRLLPAKTLHLPKCQVSVSMCELVDLLYEIMEEACVSSPQYAGRLYSTVRNIVTLYIHIVPVLHEHTLFSIPEHAALAHNNGMMLAHHCFLLGHQYKSRLPPPLCDQTITTIDLAHLLRTSYCDLFLKAMRTHRDSLMEVLREGLCSTSLGCDLAAIKDANQGVKRCLNQLQRLSAVWQNVLPLAVFSKSLGTLVNTLIEELMTRILSLRDISSDAAISLANLLNEIKEKIPALFKVQDEESTDEGDVLKNVRLWQKFLELAIVLDASLRELQDRWADGKGPFALHFTPDEGKQLIRALFQNTENRARVLSHFK